MKKFEFAATAIAPVTLITALMVYFGWIRGKSYYGYFGVNQGVLGFSVEDYLLRSTDVTIGAVLRLLTACAVLVLLDRLLSIGSRNKRWVRVSLVVLGSASTALGLLLALELVEAPGFSPVLGAMILGIGATLILRSGLWSRYPRMTGLATTVGVLILAVFWASTLYAQDLGREMAQAVDASPGRTLPLVTVFSNEPLDLPGSSIESTQIITREKDVHYRYTGLHLLTYANDRWFLITGRYSSHYRSAVITLHDSDQIRVEVARPTTDDHPGDG